MPLSLKLTGNSSNFSGTYHLSLKMPPTSKIGARRRKRSSYNSPPLPQTPTFAPRIDPSSPSHETPASSYDDPEQSTPPPPQPPPSNGAPAYDTLAPSNNSSGPPAPDYESYGPPAPESALDYDDGRPTAPPFSPPVPSNYDAPRPSYDAHDTASSYDNPEQGTPPPPQPPPSNGAPAYDTPEPSYNHSGPPAPYYESYGEPATAPPYGPPVYGEPAAAPPYGPPVPSNYDAPHPS